MKRYLAAGCLALLLCALLCGCGFWMVGHYASVTPHHDQSIQAEKTVVEVSSAFRLVDALTNMLEDGTVKVLRMYQVAQVSEATDLIYEAREDCESSIALHVGEYVQTDFTELIESYAALNQDVIIEIPQVKTNVYPQEGKEQIVELIFTYQTSLETLKFMQDKVASIFTSAELYVPQDAQVRARYA